MSLPAATVLAGMLQSCSKHPSGISPELVVMAPSSMTTSLGSAIAACTPSGTSPPTVVFDATPRIAQQIHAGFHADIVITADLEWMNWLATHDHLVGERLRLVGNSLVLVVPSDSSLGVTATDASLLLDARIHRVGLAGESVPAGRYARASLRAAGVLTQIESKIVNGDAVRTVLAWADRGEVDAAIVYATDARNDPRVRVVHTFAENSHPRIEYLIAAVRETQHTREGAALITCLRSSSGQEVLLKAGFTAP